MRTGLFFFFLMGVFSVAWGQTPVQVSRQTLKIAALGEEEIYFGFARGDVIQFTLKAKNGRKLSQIEIAEYPANTRLLKTKTAEVINETLEVASEGIYVFKIKNNSISPRVCEINIQRIPASDHYRNFNTAIRWVSVNDTTWQSSTREGIIRYDTVYTRNTSTGVKSKEMLEELILDKTQRVHARTGLKKSYSEVSFRLPEDVLNENEEKKLSSWAYWIGVDEAGNQAWEHNSKIISAIVKGTASYFLTPLGALAAGVVTDLSIPTLGEDAAYYLTEKPFNIKKKADQTFKDQGKGVAGFQKFSPSAQRNFTITLQNDNLLQGIDINVKVVAIYELKKIGKITETDMQVRPVTGKIQERTPLVKTIRKPVMVRD